MRTHLKLTFFQTSTINKIIFIAFILFHFPPCCHDALYEFKARGVNYYNNPEICRRLFYCICETQDQHCPHGFVVAPSHGMSISFLFFFSIAFHLSICFSEDCGESYNCGELVNIRYPFWGNKKETVCGQQEFKLKCRNNQTTTIYINSFEYNVLRIDQSNSRMRIARSDLFENCCPEKEIQVATMNGHRFVYSSNNQNISVWYNCSTDNEIQIPDTYKFWCGGKWEKLRRPNYAFEPSAKSWSLERGECGMNIEVMVTREGLKEGIKERKSLVEKAVKWGFDVEYENWYKDACNECNENGGKCGGNNTHPYYCICTNGIASSYDCKAPPPPLPPPHAPNIIKGSYDTWKKIMIGT